ncbi:uncharacterized protein BDZ99DRAFT_439618 [Mytilinidion resinicola]|uniref:RBR-type E3 ubiquitin transferase n=1 Tax=Mytilinidion resinicola TaxID=574789 RepID=A0A6A6YX33_9PEZI|nr:uncharacterized protein BDZ99DRAFT_439618 [Mytilinidion resinicola]KAF2812467.1 hypothetical protein BDZ99DRAFT_439618 [Mytilinidion resinicola]
MSAALATTQPAHPAHLDDEIMALALQLEEIDIHSKGQKGKHKACSPPDIDVAFSAFQAELQQAIGLLEDLKCAHSIALAVDTDSQLIREIAQEEAQGERDRRLALQLSGQNPDLALDAPPPYEEGSQEDDAGPSMTYAERQRTVLEKLPLRSRDKWLQCIACIDKFPPHEIVHAPCGTIYCTDCMKTLFMKSAKDQSLYPPSCHRQEIPLTLIAWKMSSEELAQFNTAAIEFSTLDRTYCSNLPCGKFISPDHIVAGRATCEHCGEETCAYCKHGSHTGDCPEDRELQATLELAEGMRWRRCYNCRNMLELRSGCYHMTCLCKAEFCYVCGVEWKNCSCDRWDEDNLEEQAEHRVARDVGWMPLPPQERQQRVRAMRQELLETHECDHPGRFEKIQHGGRRGFQCEMCDTRHWKFILQCRRCHIQLCQECRCNRVR